MSSVMRGGMMREISIVTALSIWDLWAQENLFLVMAKRNIWQIHCGGADLYTPIRTRVRGTVGGSWLCKYQWCQVNSETGFASLQFRAHFVRVMVLVPMSVLTFVRFDGFNYKEWCIFVRRWSLLYVRYFLHKSDAIFHCYESTSFR